MKAPLPKSLHSNHLLNEVKLVTFRKLSDAELRESLKPGKPGSLKARPDGTKLEGHHRVKILRERGVEVDSLPRQIVTRE